MEILTVEIYKEDKSKKGKREEKRWDKGEKGKIKKKKTRLDNANKMFDEKNKS